MNKRRRKKWLLLQLRVNHPKWWDQNPNRTLSKIRGQRRRKRRGRLLHSSLFDNKTWRKMRNPNIAKTRKWRQLRNKFLTMVSKAIVMSKSERATKRRFTSWILMPKVGSKSYLSFRSLQRIEWSKQLCARAPTCNFSTKRFRFLAISRVAPKSSRRSSWTICEISTTACAPIINFKLSAARMMFHYLWELRISAQTDSTSTQLVKCT